MKRVYPNNLKSWEFDKEAAQIFASGASSFSQEQSESEDRKFAPKPMQSKTNFSSCLGILIAASLFTSVYNGESMQLVNTNTGFVVVEFSNGKAEFHDRFLEAEMKEEGILIPSALASQFEGKKVIFFGDPLFEKAFKEIYYPLCIANSIYQWKK